MNFSALFASPLSKSLNSSLNIEVVSPPEDSVSALKFSPAALQKDFLIAGSWDNSVRCWEVDPTGKTVSKSVRTLSSPILDVCWSEEGTKAFVASGNNQVNMWDLVADHVVPVAAHDAPVKTCHWIKATNYECLMTGSWDKTLKFWDIRSPNPMLTINLPERCYCADVDYPLAVVGTANRGLIAYSLENFPTEFKRHESSLTTPNRGLSIFKDKNMMPIGFGLASSEGRVVIEYLNSECLTQNFSFVCHRIKNSTGFVDVYAVNDIVFHPVHGTLATVGSDGTYCFWDKNARVRLKTSETMDQAITKCDFNSNGQIFAYALGYDWSKGYEYYNPAKKPQIFLRPCFEDLKPRLI